MTRRISRARRRVVVALLLVGVVGGCGSVPAGRQADAVCDDVTERIDELLPSPGGLSPTSPKPIVPTLDILIGAAEQGRVGLAAIEPSDAERPAHDAFLGQWDLLTTRMRELREARRTPLDEQPLLERLDSMNAGNYAEIEAIRFRSFANDAGARQCAAIPWRGVASS